LRGLLGELLFDVLAIGFTVEFQRVGALETWGTGQLHTVEDLRANKDLEIGIVRASIPAISNVTTVHNFTIDVAEIIIGDLFILGEVVVEHITTNSKITIVEVVVTGPTLATELLTTENKRVEHAQAEEESFELGELVSGSSFEVCLVEHVEGTTDVCFKVSRCLISHLD